MPFAKGKSETQKSKMTSLRLHLVVELEPDCAEILLVTAFLTG